MGKAGLACDGCHCHGGRHLVDAFHRDAFGVAIGVTGFGFFMIGTREVPAPKLILSGIFMGIGIVSMHYTGMAAMHMPADIRFQGDCRRIGGRGGHAKKTKRMIRLRHWRCTAPSGTQLRLGCVYKAEVWRRGKRKCAFHGFCWL
jgi:hypothetical protein